MTTTTKPDLLSLAERQIAFWEEDDAPVCVVEPTPEESAELQADVDYYNDLRAAIAAERERRKAAYDLAQAANVVACRFWNDPRRECEPGCDCHACKLDAALARYREVRR